eukprot:scaffold3443_cov404-Prasinococcus_capsulatus_cf.AAC.12
MVRLEVDQGVEGGGLLAGATRPHRDQPIRCRLLPSGGARGLPQLASLPSAQRIRATAHNHDGRWTAADRFVGGDGHRQPKRHLPSWRPRRRYEPQEIPGSPPPGRHWMPIGPSRSMGIIRRVGSRPGASLRRLGIETRILLDS